VKRAFHVYLCGLALAAASVAVGAAPRSENTQAATLKNPMQASAASLEKGQALYDQHCIACHGEQGEGGVGAEGLAPPSNLADATWDHGATDGDIFSAIKSGLPPEFAMEAWGDRITDPDIWNLVNYLRSLGN
jgi:cytochrome c oxidase cbb3-type subunit 3